jgi:hypothetical protein
MGIDAHLDDLPGLLPGSLVATQHCSSTAKSATAGGSIEWSAGGTGALTKSSFANEWIIL